MCLCLMARILFVTLSIAFHAQDLDTRHWSPVTSMWDPVAIYRKKTNKSISSTWNLPLLFPSTFIYIERNVTTLINFFKITSFTTFLNVLFFILNFLLNSTSGRLKILSTILLPWSVGLEFSFFIFLRLSS